MPIACRRLSRVRRAESYLLGIDNVHDDATLQHSRQTRLDGESVLTILGGVAVGRGQFSCHCVVWRLRSIEERKNIGGEKPDEEKSTGGVDWKKEEEEGDGRERELEKI